ncbi:MAG: hypothetical protein Q8897_01070 [Sweet potato little leaf phytoplasma]|uniref:Uncharacterized protein n=1 Tax=Peanut witches'-broom phytoplasma NTU2011 TaxID=1163385 RepID=A0ABP2TGA0_PEWBP|nr:MULTISPECIES: hypothetical protein [16SrII (Peanut WB group)]MDV3163863.1 hypothetical protein [Candidatus Phytoplasma australasiaticum]QLL36980.1 hypothetical protein EPWB_v2c3920 ['Echinacea purpurea' witches'-broom phytoplasma]WEX20302.1 MAG: hypothetical protein TB2022_2080 [Candidatus Phytoplasma aurantifolia]EMR14681.1 hypothetical protein PNWB_v1c1410 [Peanut witches'-broom phytoplasma NTU2011]MDO7987121.1 hypothetical protein [Sweet potato little leaf phytoplasma]
MCKQIKKKIAKTLNISYNMLNFAINITLLVLVIIWFMQIILAEMQINLGTKLSYKDFSTQLEQNKNITSINIQDSGNNFFNKDSYKRIEIKTNQNNVFFTDTDEPLYIKMLSKIFILLENNNNINLNYKTKTNHLSSLLLSLSILCATLNGINYLMPKKIKNWFNDILPS